MTTFSEDRTIDPVTSLRKAADLIATSFIYSSTTGGNDYWRQVVTDLRELASEAEKAGYPTISQKEYYLRTKFIYDTSLIDDRIPKKIHIMHQGKAGCSAVTGDPRTWPKEHEWVYRNDASKANCTACKENLGLI